jgi:hypothetical protein
MSTLTDHRNHAELLAQPRDELAIDHRSARTRHTIAMTLSFFGR